MVKKKHRNVTDDIFSVEITKEKIMKDGLRGRHVFLGVSKIFVFDYNGRHWNPKYESSRFPEVYITWQKFKRDKDSYFWKIPDKSEIFRKIAMMSASTEPRWPNWIRFHPLSDAEEQTIEIQKMSAPEAQWHARSLSMCMRFYPYLKGQWPPELSEDLPLLSDDKLFFRRKKKEKITTRCLLCDKEFESSNFRKAYCEPACKQKAFVISRRIAKEVRNYYEKPKKQRSCEICGDPIPLSKKSNALFCDACDIPWKRRVYYRNRRNTLDSLRD